MKKTLTILLICVCVNTYSQSALEDKVRLFIELSGSSQALDVAMDRMIEIQKEVYSSLPDIYWQELETIFLDSLKTELYNKIIPIYCKHLSEEDIDGIIDFYNSSAGKNLATKQPVIISETFDVSKSIGKSFGGLVFNSVQDKLKTIFENDHHDCDCAKEGSFIIKYGESEYLLERSIDEQIEIFENYRTTYRIEWIEDCKYTLEAIESNDPDVQIKKNGPSSTVCVYGCEDDNFEFIIYLKEYNSFVFGESSKKQ